MYYVHEMITFIALLYTGTLLETGYQAILGTLYIF